jgi:two-component system, NtrC family, response regulator GlrR
LSDEFDSQTEVQPNASLSTSVIRRTRTVAWTDADGAHEVRLEGRMILGSSQHAPIRVSDRAVSRVHAEIEVAEDGIWLRDLGSRNGSWVEGVLCKLARIEDGARLRVGNVTMQVRVEGESASVPLWPYDRFDDLVARSEVMRELFMRLSQYAHSDASVLVQGETGTGKELVARAIHRASPRSNGPLVVVDCGALPENLLETELFGHVRGAFTGAQSTRVGAIESADGGTVFLDEIGELPLAMQPKLLRVLESKTVRRIGETEHRNVDVRFVSATHRDLQQLVASGAFREDLYFRLSVLPVHVPPLRARPVDIPLLVAHFLRERAPNVVLSPELEQEIARHVWLGNVRELRSFVDRVTTIGPDAAWALTRGDVAAQSARTAPPVPRLGSDLPEVRIDVPFKELRETWTDHLEREYVRKLIEQHGRNLATLAAAAGLDRTYVRRLIQKHSL